MQGKPGEPAARTRRLGNDPYTYLAIGILIGILLMLLIGTGLYGLGYLSFGQATPPPPPACPATATLAPECPTSEPCPTDVPCPPTPTLDLRATATAACAEFQSQFRGTPCP
jgi:hypothetical protein